MGRFYLVIMTMMMMMMVGCESRPISPEEARRREIQAHCENVATAARAEMQAEQEQAAQGNVPGGFWGGVASARDYNAAYDAAYGECMYRFTGTLK